MKPQPMSDAEIAEVERDSFIGVGRPTAGFDRDRFARAIIAARDAQWAAMIGEPVAWERDGGSEWTNLPKEAAFWESLHKDEPDLWGKPTPLYAIKETP